MKIQDYVDATYLKTAKEANCTESQNWIRVKNLVEEAMQENYKAVMIRPNHVKATRSILSDSNSSVQLGTVIDFPLGNGGMVRKLSEAQKALNHGADELDFVLDYNRFLIHGFNKIKDELLENTQMVLVKGATVKWIVESAALPKSALEDLCANLSEVFLNEFGEEHIPRIFIKSSTGYFSTQPNGATIASIKTMLDFGKPFPIKASGGVRTADQAKQFIDLGVKRIGTSSAKQISDEWEQLI